VVGAGLFVPRIERGFGDVVGECVLVVVRQVKGRGLLLLDRYFSGGTLDVEVALEDSQTGDLRRRIDAEMCLPVE